jgi:hypothetical protein
MTSRLIVVVHHQHPTPDLLDRSLRRYARAVVECLSAPGVLGDHDVLTSVRMSYAVNPEYDERLNFTGAVAIDIYVSSDFGSGSVKLNPDGSVKRISYP